MTDQIFDKYFSLYNYEKYPANDYERYKLVFSSLNQHNSEIENALKWKWGHEGKENFPEKQKALIIKVQQLWGDFTQTNATSSPEATFNWWQRRLPKTAYITTAYITHLVHHAAGIPIIDQHNFRAMNTLLKDSGKTATAKKKPSSWNDIVQLKQFIEGLITELDNRSFGDIDKFLMMYGRSIKDRKPRTTKIKETR